MTNTIQITKEKINVAKLLINSIERKILDKNVLTHDMLKSISSDCQKLIESDF